MKIWKHFKTFADARPRLYARKCWSKCYRCNKTWGATGTEYVSMLYIGKDIKYACDDCTEILEKTHT